MNPLWHLAPFAVCVVVLIVAAYAMLDELRPGQPAPSPAAMAGLTAAATIAALAAAISAAPVVLWTGIL